MSKEIAGLLREIRDQQRRQFERYEAQPGRIRGTNDRAGVIQCRAVKSTRVTLWVALPLAPLALAAMPWPRARYLAYKFA